MVVETDSVGQWSLACPETCTGRRHRASSREVASDPTLRSLARLQIRIFILVCVETWRGLTWPRSCTHILNSGKNTDPSCFQKPGGVEGGGEGGHGRDPAPPDSTSERAQVPIRDHVWGLGHRQNQILFSAMGC
jgi:hypothetical protein